MFSEEDRIASFAGPSSSSHSTSASKRKQPSKGSSNNVATSWPHPTTGRAAKSSGIPSPSTLAKYGFYFAPNEDAPDAVAHILYPETTIAHWQSGDDPLTKLDKVLPGNSWCKIIWSKEGGVQSIEAEEGKSWTWTSPELLPTSKAMIEARKQTFGSEWPYDGKKGWKPTSKKLAEAGFYFNPSEEEQDNATCIYCSKSLGGWEKGDDPYHEHHRRMPHCPFFNCTVATQDEPVTQSNSSEDIKVDEEDGLRMPKKGKRVASAATTRKASTRTIKGKKPKEAGDEPAEEEDLDEAEERPDVASKAAPSELETEALPAVEANEKPTRKASRKTRAVSSRKAPPSEPEPQAEPEAEPEPKLASKKQNEKESSSESKEQVSTQLEPAAAASKPARSMRAASRRATKAIELLSADDDVNHIPRRPDADDLRRRELALSDPVLFPTSDPDLVAPATDPVVETSKPKRSRSKPKKLHESVSVKEPTPEPEPVNAEENAMEEAENTMIEHDVSDVEQVAEEPEPEQPKRRGRSTKASVVTTLSSSAMPTDPISSSSPSTARTRKASSKIAMSETKSIDEAEPDSELMPFPTMSSEPDPLPRSKSKKSTANAKTLKSKSRRGTVAAPTSELGALPTMDSQDVIVVDEDLESDDLPNAESQATIMGIELTSSRQSGQNGEDEQQRRSPLSQLSQFQTLELTEGERTMTLGQWLQTKAAAAAQEMRQNGNLKLQDLENQMQQGRIAIERALRGQQA